mmetsp:Transcript_9372/g.18014  ORF Transcript_9372/g.18014 Transcript_9372/m.18014 type:complete len:84 (-) Transcript_9372:3341-3592(-)
MSDLHPELLQEFSQKVKGRRRRGHEKVVLGHKNQRKTQKEGFFLEVLTNKPALERVKPTKTKEFEAELLGRHKRLSLSRIIRK